MAICFVAVCFALGVSVSGVLRTRDHPGAATGQQVNRHVGDTIVASSRILKNSEEFNKLSDQDKQQTLVDQALTDAAYAMAADRYAEFSEESAEDARNKANRVADAWISKLGGASGGAAPASEGGTVATPPVQLVDMAHIISIDGNSSVDVTQAINLMIGANGHHDITNRLHMRDVIRDPSPGKRKVLQVQKGNNMIKLNMAEGPYNLDTLFGRPHSRKKQVAGTQQVDSAIFRRVDDVTQSIDVTHLLNMMIRVNGVQTPAGSSTLGAIAGDPAPGAAKILEVRRGDKQITIPAPSTYDLSELFDAGQVM